MSERNNEGCFQEPYVGCSEAHWVASEHRSMGVLRGTLDRGHMKHRIGSCMYLGQRE